MSPDLGQNIGKFPKGLKSKLTPEERLMGSIFHEYPSVDAVRSRTPIDVVTLRLEEVARAAEHKRKILGLPEGATISPELAAQSIKVSVDRILFPLSDVENTVLRMRFGLDDGTQKSKQAVGESLGYSAKEVGKVEDEALGKLRESLGRSARAPRLIIATR